MEEVKQSKIIPEKLRLVRIVQKQFSVDASASNVRSFQLNMGQHTMHNIEKKSVKITLSIQAVAEVNVASFLYDFFFTVDNIDDYHTVNDDKVIFNGAFISTLLSISYSTLRGVLTEKCASTVLKHFILPIIDPNKLLEARITDAN